MLMVITIYTIEQYYLCDSVEVGVHWGWYLIIYTIIPMSFHRGMGYIGADMLIIICTIVPMCFHRGRGTYGLVY